MDMLMFRGGIREDVNRHGVSILKIWKHRHGVSCKFFWDIISWCSLTCFLFSRLSNWYARLANHYCHCRRCEGWNRCLLLDSGRVHHDDIDSGDQSTSRTPLKVGAVAGVDNNIIKLGVGIERIADKILSPLGASLIRFRIQRYS